MTAPAYIQVQESEAGMGALYVGTRFFDSLPIALRARGGAS